MRRGGSVVDSLLIKTFSADKYRFFADRNLLQDPHRMKKVRNQSRYRFDVQRMTEGGIVEKNKLYLSPKIPATKEMPCYQYKYLDAYGSPINGLNPVDYQTILKDIYKKGHNGFYYVAQHRALIEQEFNDLYAVLERNGHYAEEFWLYCYSMCFDLENYYLDDAYPDPVKAARYHQLRKHLEYRCEHGTFQNNENPPAIARTIGQQLHETIKDLQHTAAIRGWIGLINLYRILFVFSRLAVKYSLIMAEQLKWLEQLSHSVGHTFDFNILIATINAPTALMNVLGVAVFEVRLCIIVGEILKHVWFGATEKETSRLKSERLKQEIIERGLDIYNDLAWSIVNTLCNYGYLADSIALQLTVVFLLLDALVILCHFRIAHQAYLLKKGQYDNDIKFYREQNTFSPQHIELLNLQRRQLDIEWGATRAKLLFQLSGAFLLMGGFSATLFFSSPAVAMVGFITCTVAVAMFLSSGEFHGYIKACLIESDRQPTDDLNPIPAASVGDVRFVFYKAMAKNTVMPLVMVTAFTLYWPGALLLAAGYLFNENRGASLLATRQMPPTSLEAEKERCADLDALPRLVF